MRGSGWIGIVTAASIGLAGCFHLAAPSGTGDAECGLASVQPLWERTITPYLADPLWNVTNGYDAGHYLMLPMYAAFAAHDAAAVRQFAAHYAAAAAAPETDYARHIDRMQYDYAAAQYLVLAAAADEPVPAGLVERLDRQAEHWRTVFEERIVRKIAGPVQPPRFTWALEDPEIFAMAIAADVVTYHRTVGTSPPEGASGMASLARPAFEARVTAQAGGGWLLNVGFRVDDPEYAYAGHAAKAPNLTEKPVTNISDDTSHSHRLPAWLQSFRRAAAAGSSEATYFANLTSGLATQLLGRVLIPPSDEFPAIRTTNFMDGSNGLYRWRYPTNPDPDDGVGPYELSGTFLLGWWAFLGNATIDATYAELADAFPLPEHVIATYVGPNTTRARHPLVQDPDLYTNGFRELLVNLAGMGCVGR